MDYPANTYVLPTPDPVMFQSFYLYCFEHGIDGILIASCGTDSPYEGSYEQLAARINRVYERMKERGLDIRRMKLTSDLQRMHEGVREEAERARAGRVALGSTAAPTSEAAS